MLCHLFLGYNRLGIFLRHRPFALRSRSLSLARQLKGLHGGVGLFWKNPPMPLYWLARKWWAKTAPCPTAMQHSRAPSTGTGSGSFFGNTPLRQAQGAAVFCCAEVRPLSQSQRCLFATTPLQSRVGVAKPPSLARYFLARNNTVP